jgi:hypothetical protein
MGLLLLLGIIMMLKLLIQIIPFLHRLGLLPIRLLGMLILQLLKELKYYAPYSIDFCLTGASSTDAGFDAWLAFGSIIKISWN